MNLEQLKILETIIETGSFRSAAQKLNNSQPNLSRAIKKLEDELGIKLLDRSSYRPLLTKEGEAFSMAANRTLRAADNLKILGQELGLKNVESEIRISVDPLVPPALLAKIIEIGTSQDISPKFFIKTSVLSEASNDVQKGISDLAIGPNQKSLKHVDFQHVTNVELETVVSKTAFKKYKMNERRLLANLPQILISQGTFVETPDKFQVSPLTPTTKEVYVSDHSLKLEIIRRGLGWGKIADHEIQNFPRKDLVALKIVSRPKFILPFYIMRNDKKPLGPICRRIIDELANATKSRSL